MRAFLIIPLKAIIMKNRYCSVTVILLVGTAVLGLLGGCASQGNTALHYAAKKGDASQVKKFLARQDDIEVENDAGITPVVQAVMSYVDLTDQWKPADEKVIQKYQQTIRLLVDAGADINVIIDRKGYDPAMLLSYAIRDVSSRSGDRPQDVEMVEFLLEVGADPNQMTWAGSPLFYAINDQRYDMAKVLLDNGASPWVLPGYIAQQSRRSNYLEYAKVFNRDELYGFLYPYMKDAFTKSNKTLVKDAKKYIKAVLAEDSDTIKTMCMSNPEHRIPWSQWSKLIREDYAGHEKLLESMTSGWYSFDGFADVFVPVGPGKDYNYIKLTFFHHREGMWKCGGYSRYKEVPKPQEYELYTDGVLYGDSSYPFFKKYGMQN